VPCTTCLLFVAYRPFIEMTIPSSLDSTLAPPGGHVVQLFTQYTPYKLASGQTWTDDMRNKYADTGLPYCRDKQHIVNQNVIGTIVNYILSKKLDDK